MIVASKESSFTPDILVKKVFFVQAWRKNWCYRHAYLCFVSDNPRDIEGSSTSIVEQMRAEENIRALLYNVALGFIDDKKGGVLKLSVEPDCWYCKKNGEYSR